MNREATVTYLKQLQSATESILRSADKQAIGGPVNWADLHCVSAEYILDNYDDERYEVVIEEASPDARELTDHVNEQLGLFGYKNVFARTEW